MSRQVTSAGQPIIDCTDSTLSLSQHPPSLFTSFSAVTNHLQQNCSVTSLMSLKYLSRMLRNDGYNSNTSSKVSCECIRWQIAAWTMLCLLSRCVAYTLMQMQSCVDKWIINLSNNKVHTGGSHLCNFLCFHLMQFVCSLSANNWSCWDELFAINWKKNKKKCFNQIS